MPALFMQVTMFWVTATGAVTTWTSASRRLPTMPERVGDAVLPVDRELPGDDVDDLVVLRDLHAPGGVDDPGDVLLGDLPVLAGDGDDAPAVEGADVGARDARPRRGRSGRRP